MSSPQQSFLEDGSSIDPDNMFMEENMDYDESAVAVHTQKAALKRSTPAEPLIVTPGELITERAEGVLRGHGTFVEDGKLYSSVCGVVERVNKLISVRPLRARYVGEVGDVIVGRIRDIKVGGKRWKVDIQGRQDATLLLSSVNLPGGVQRRKTYEDQLNMRNLFVEDDAISAEVQQFFGDGTVSLQTRSASYGKLGQGCFVRVYSALVKRCKKHFCVFPFGITVILGNNGYIWITVQSEEEQQKSTPFGIDQPAVGEKKQKNVSLSQRENIVRVRNCILALQERFLPIYPETILDVFESASSLKPKEILQSDKIPVITASAAERVKKLAEEQQREQH